MRDGERTLLTHAGANTTFADHLDGAFDELADYLTRARFLHVTSFLDDRSPGRLRALLTAVKAKRPQTLISLDPGHVWCTNRTADIDGILRLADFLLVNRREFEALGDLPGNAVTVVKQPSGTRWHGPGGDGFRPQKPLPTAEIGDATGAGDVFAAGLLTELCRDPTRLGPGCDLGMHLAREKLRRAV
ncbi:sugar/nucleoside kinase (ribokinase family) [Actinoplanes tereljensis]|uniref:Carbohydrate kinase PfkB domain-containing protein n=2 Tax=Paractinoplanes tereljensis TaxID=571912 RepID=A0A919TX70_9ACTN|nr:hypothetical protein Ate02nite_86560 [Actinoplanes tereljensis]